MPCNFRQSGSPGSTHPVRQIGFKSFDMLRQVCHMSCLHFPQDKDVSDHPSGIPKEEMPEPSQKIVLKCVSISLPSLSLYSCYCLYL